MLIEVELTPAALVAAVTRLEAMGPDGLRGACERRAALFDEAVFIARMRAVLQEAR